MNMTIGERMKANYEDRSKSYLTRRTPVILRIDGKAFHSYAKGFYFPFDQTLLDSFIYSTERIMKDIQGAKCAYIQSDEVSIFITDFDRLNTEAWFNYDVQKMTSVASSLFTAYFNHYMIKTNPDIGKIACFDARVFNLPKEEVVNYFIWRQKDWERNSISMLARFYYSHSECQGKSLKQLNDMIYEAGDNWNNLPIYWKRGVFIEENIYSPDFNSQKNIFDNFLVPEED